MDKGCIRCRHEGLDIRVSPASLERALMIMDTLLKRLEAKGCMVSLNKQGYKNVTSVKVSDMTFNIDLYEKINILKKSKDRYGLNGYDYVPNGRLVLRIKNAPSGARAEWLDGDTKKLERRIDSFIEGLNKCVAREEELKLVRIKWQEEYRKKDEAARNEELEREKGRALERDALSWQKSQTVRAYVEAAIEAYITKNGNIEPGSNFDKWRAWASEQADCMDPLRRPDVSRQNDSHCADGRQEVWSIS